MILISFIAVSGIAIALFTVLLASGRSNLRLPDRLFISWLITLALNQFYFLITGFELLSFPATIHFFGTALPLLHAPLLYLFSKYVFSTRLPVREAVHLLPFGLFILAFSTLLWTTPGLIDFRYGFIWFNEPAFPFNLYGLYLAASAGGYTLAALFSIRAHKKHLAQTQSSELRNVLNWLQRWLVAALAFFAITYVIVELSVSHMQFNSRFTFHFVSIFMSCYILYVSFWGIRKTDAFRRFNPQDLELLIGKLPNCPTPPESEALANKLKLTLEKEQLYLDPDLSLARLSEVMKVPPGKLSYIINQHIGKNFYDFINEYRVDEFLRRLPDSSNAHLSLLGLAYDCGFRSKSTFNAFFKKQVGQTPSALKKSLENKSG